MFVCVMCGCCCQVVFVKCLCLLIDVSGCVCLLGRAFSVFENMFCLLCVLGCFCLCVFVVLCVCWLLCMCCLFDIAPTLSLSVCFVMCVSCVSFLVCFFLLCVCGWVLDVCRICVRWCVFVYCQMLCLGYDIVVVVCSMLSIG